MLLAWAFRLMPESREKRYLGLFLALYVKRHLAAYMAHGDQSSEGNGAGGGMLPDGHQGSGLT